jgi:hypothetical protein
MEPPLSPTGSLSRRQGRFELTISGSRILMTTERSDSSQSNAIKGQKLNTH